MRMNKCFTTSLVVTFALMAVGLTHAQPEPNNVPMGANPPAGGNWAQMTPEQRQQVAQQFVEQTIRDSMKRIGYDDKLLQDEVIAFSNEQEKLLIPVRKKHRKVTQAILDNKNEEEVAALMSALRASIEKTKAKRELAILVLDEKISFSNKPKLEAFLSLLGLTGSETSYIGGTLSNMLGIMGNLGLATPDDNGEDEEEEAADEEGATEPAAEKKDNDE